MPVLIRINKKIKKTGKKEYFYYIVENRTLIKGGQRKTVRNYLKSLGRITKTQAYIELGRFVSNQKELVVKKQKIPFDEAVLKTEIELQQEVGINISLRTFQDFKERIVKCNEYFNTFSLNEISYRDIENFKEHLIKKGLGNRTINIVLVQLRKVFKWGLKHEYTNEIPLVEYLLERKANVIDRLTRLEIQNILDCSQNEKVTFYIRFMLLTGMRPNELHKLKWEHTYLDGGYIHVISDNKRKRGRKIPIQHELKKLIEDWKSSSLSSDIFVSPYLNRHSVATLFRRLGEKCNISLTAYKLRKTFASIMAENGVDRGKLAEIMGNSIATGEKYYIDVQHQHLRDEMKVMGNVMNEYGGK